MSKLKIAQLKEQRKAQKKLNWLTPAERIYGYNNSKKENEKKGKKGGDKKTLPEKKKKMINRLPSRTRI